MSEGDQQDDVREEAALEVRPVAGEVGRAIQPPGAEAVVAHGFSRHRRGQGRRVTLARQRQGNYSIWMQSRHIQGFCNEWEDITNFQLPEGFEQQVRINIEVVGEAREIRPEYSGEGQDSQVEVAQASPPRLEGRNADGDLIGMFHELSANSRELITGQIRALHQAQHHGAALLSTAHPRRDPVEEERDRRVQLQRANRVRPDFSDVVEDLRDSVRQMLHILEQLP